MKLLHTADWHLGRTLFGRRRYEEFEAFLDWLGDTIDREAIDALLIAGDVFDTTTPSNRAQALYYRFLCRVAASHCRHVVVIGGNHDSPTFLDAPRELLQALDVHVVGQARENPAEEVIVLRDAEGQPELIVCAVPYLRDRDVRHAEAGESLVDKERKLLDGIRQHYAAVTHAAQTHRDRLEMPVPIVGMGHLFTAGAQTMDGDGVRDLYVGSLAHVGASLFPDCLDYVALGHLHVPQIVAGRQTLRYSGSPIAMGFGEANQRKSVCVVHWDTLGQTAPTEVQCLEVPVFQRLARLRGDWTQIEQGLRDWLARDEPCWLEIVYDGQEVIADLRERITVLTEGSALEVLRIRNQRLIARAIERMHTGEHLHELDVQEVFERCLDAHAIPPAQRPALMRSYQETLLALQQRDDRAH